MSKPSSKSLAFDERSSMVSQYVQEQVAREMAAFYSAFKTAGGTQERAPSTATKRTEQPKKRSDR